MKKFQFRLDRVLRYHQQRLKQAELLVAQAAMERDSARVHVVRCERQIDAACQLNEKVGGVVNPMIRSNVTAHLEQLGKILKAAREQFKGAEQRFREKDRARMAISEDAEGLSLLRDQQRLEHHNEVIRQQQIDLDEIVLRKWQFQGDDDPSTNLGLSE